MRTTGLQGHASALPCAGRATARWSIETEGDGEGRGATRAAPPREREEEGERKGMRWERENERGRDERVGVNELRGKMITEG